MTPTGKVTQSWTFDDIMTKKERTSLPRSISHTRWLSEKPTMRKGIVALKSSVGPLRFIPGQGIFTRGTGLAGP